MKKHTGFPILLCFGIIYYCLVSLTPVLAAEFSLEKTDKGYDVKIDGKLFVGYITDQQGTPILWPIIGPTGAKMTRDYPMVPGGSPGETLDHEHHRSLWFTHGEVNKSNFWLISKETPHDTVKHEKFLKAESDGKTATLQTANSWITKSGEVLCKDIRTFVFRNAEQGRLIDFDITLTGVADETRFCDTKEGTFGMRVPTSLDVIVEKMNKDKNWGGKIVNAQGDKDDAAWGKRSEWCDYSGPVEGKTVGITIMNHPDSFRYPTYWHVRTYGLFAANPFGEHDFLAKKEKSGEYVLKKGESITFRYRVLLHKGDADSLNLKNAFDTYKNPTAK